MKPKETTETSRIPQLSQKRLEELGFDQSLQEQIKADHDKILSLLAENKDVSDAVLAVVNQYIPNEGIDTDSEEISASLNPLQFAWLESHFQLLAQSSELSLSKVEQEKLEEGVRVLELAIASSGMSKKELSKMAKLGKVPGWLLKKTAALGNIGCMALLVVLGVMMYASVKLALSSAVQTEANLRAVEENGKKIDPAAKARDAMDENIRVQAETVLSQEKILGDLNRIRSLSANTQLINALERVYRSEFLEHYMTRSLVGLGESALRARQDLGDNETVNQRVTTYTHGLLLLARIQVDTEIKRLEFQRSRGQWLSVSTAAANARSESSPSPENNRLNSLIQTRQFLDKFIFSFGGSSIVLNPLDPQSNQRTLRIDLNNDGDTDDRGEVVPGVPFRRDFGNIDRSGITGSISDLDLSPVKLDGLLPQGANFQQLLTAIFNNDPVIDIRLLNAFVRSARNGGSGVLYSVAASHKASRSRFERAKAELGALENGLPADRSEEILAEIKREISGEWPRIRAQQEDAQGRIAQNVEDLQALEVKIQAIKKKYHLDDPFVRGALKFARWVYGDPLAVLNESESDKK